ncbi:MAG: phosphotyrosine protein phosphatase [Elusimicrobia bacterium]|nr:phosphotyrosine protein phosphatase [Elusimicrobiota bacterium]
MRRALFICGRNRLRSPTAERIFQGRGGFEISSAGLNPGADVRVSSELLEQADLVFVMENAQRAKLMKTFGSCLKGKKVVCLGIPDDYGYMDSELIRLLEAKAGPFFAR